MSNLVMWSTIIGFFSPLVLAVINRRAWGDVAKAVTVFIWSLFSGAVTIYFQQPDWDWGNYVGSVLLILVTAISTYKGLWQKTGVAPKIEAKTG